MGLSALRGFALCLVSTSWFACGEAPDDAPVDNLDFDGAVEALSTPVTVSAGRTSTTRFTTRAALTTVTINCAPPSDPDAVGMTFRVSAPDLGAAGASGQPPRAGYFSWTGALAAGSHALSLTGVSGSGSCRVTTGTATGTCGRAIVRSQNTNHTHFRVGSDTSADWEPFPASGNHWGAWPAWGSDYPRPVMHGFLLHGLEHGGVVLSYKCSSATQSAACRDAHAQLTALAQRFGNHRVIVTPDPTQPTLFAVRAWRWSYTAECLDADNALSFMRGRYRHGREDIDADPPIPYDPTTTRVPCQDLMAAPDSC